MKTDIIKLRSNTLSSIRTFLDKNNFLEADVPTLVPALIPESYLEVFETTLTAPHNKRFTAYLTASPEAYLKRLLTEIKSNVFYLGHAYRNNEPLGKTHNHEFTILEWYYVGATYHELMRHIEEMLRTIHVDLKKKGLSNININFDSPFEYITVSEAFKAYAHTDADTLSPEEFEKQYVQFIEPNLGTRGRPTFLTDFPAWQSPLAKTKKTDERIAERFELYINGIELINGWTELTDWKKQQKNFDKEQASRNEMNKVPYPVDFGFIEKLKTGMPECAGAAMGIDRLLMVLGGYSRIEEVILFPDSKLFG